MFYLMTHSTHFIYGYMMSDNMVKDHSDSVRGNPLLPHGLLFSINSKGSFICTITDRMTYTTAFVTPVVEHWLEREISQWVHSMKDRPDDPSHHERTLLPRSYISLRPQTYNILLCWGVVKHSFIHLFIHSFKHNTALLIPVPVLSFRFMARRRNRVSGLKLASLSETWRLCRWLCKVNLRTSNVYIFKQYFI